MTSTGQDQGAAVAATRFVSSKDGTRIAYDLIGDGQAALVLVDGAFMNRSFPNPISEELAARHTVYRYDRRGRNESGDTQPYAVAREVEDIEALIDEAGGSACVFGMSSGAVLALEAAASGLAIKKLALYEPPLLVDGSRPPVPEDYLQQVKNAIARGSPGDAVEVFMTAAIGMPKEAVSQIRNDPSWAALEAVAHTLAYDGSIMEGLMLGRPLPVDRVERWSSINVPALVVDGGASWAFMRTGADALAEVLPQTERRTLEGQSHDVSADVLAPVLFEFFGE
jgi:pimeloyl-ACP methyl ester carboxylesterase